MPRNHVIREINNIGFTVIRMNYQNPAGDFFIYTIEPDVETKYRRDENNQSLLKRDPKFHTYSLFASTKWPAGSEIHADIEEVRNGKTGKTNYVVKKVVYTWPKSPTEQWNFLRRFADNQNYRRVLNALEDHMNYGELILDKITEDVLDSDVQKWFIDRPKDLARWSNFKKELNEYKSSANFIKYLPKGVAKDLTDAQLQKLAELREGNPKESAKAFLNNPFEAITLDGFGFKTIDGIREKLHKTYPNNHQYDLNNIDRIFYGAYDLIENKTLKQGDTFLYLDQFKKEMLNTLQITGDELEQFITIDLNNPNVGRKDFKVVINGDTVTTQKLWNAENNIFNYFEQPHKMKPFNNFSEKLDSFLEANEATLTEEQKSVFSSINENQATMLVGPGGVGKTWTVGKLVKFAREDLDLKVLLTAPTGKASQVLSRYTNYKASTVHSAFHVASDQATGLVDSYDLIVIDEFSMVYSELMNVIVESIKKNPNTRILLVGDEFQLPSVGPGNILHDLIKHKVINTVRLTKVFRTKDANGGITELSTELRKGSVTLKNNDDRMYANGLDLAVQNITDTTQLRNRVLGVYNHLLEDGATPDEIMVLVPKNQGVTGQNSLNNNIQTLIRRTEDPDEVHLNRDVYGTKVKFYKNDAVMFNKNRDYFSTLDTETVPTDDTPTVEVHNGDTGQIISLTKHGMIVRVVGIDKPIFVEATDLGEITLAYAITIHKSQGSQSEYGIMAIAPNDSFMLNANLLYTGVSRIKSRLYLVGDLNKIRFRSKTFINHDRNTILDKLLNEKVHPF